MVFILFSYALSHSINLDKKTLAAPLFASQHHT